MLSIAVPAGWNPDDAGPWRDFARNSLVILIGQPGDLLGPMGLISWYETGAESDGPDPRFNLTLPMGLCRR